MPARARALLKKGVLLLFRGGGRDTLVVCARSLCAYLLISAPTTCMCARRSCSASLRADALRVGAQLHEDAGKERAGWLASLFTTRLTRFHSLLRPAPRLFQPLTLNCGIFACDVIHVMKNAQQWTRLQNSLLCFILVKNRFCFKS